MFTIGVVWFAVASAGCALAPTAGVLIVARGLQGVGGALLTPGSLAILQASFVKDDRARAIGAWSGLGGLASAAGPIVGGYLLTVASWRWVFLINLPLSLAVVLITRRHVPESVDSGAHGRVDVPGAVWAVVALSGLTYPVIEGPDVGWSSPAIIVSIVVGVCGSRRLRRHRTTQPQPDAAARDVRRPAVRGHQCGDVRRLRGPERVAVPDARRVAAGRRVLAARIRPGVASRSR